MKAVVTGATGHCGSYLVPELVRMGYEVYGISRGMRSPYTAGDPAWEKVKMITCDRRDSGDFEAVGKIVSEIEPDIVCDLISYSLDEIKGLCGPILKKPDLCRKLHIIQVGTIWVYGVKRYVPVTEDHERNGLSEYGINKAIIERYLHGLSGKGVVRTTVIHPGHISGRGWVPINPQGNLNIEVYKDIMTGREVILPDFGLSTLHHVHSADITGMIKACILNPERSTGETFNAVTEKAVTLEGFAQMLYEHYGHEPKIKCVSRGEFSQLVSESDYRVSESHLIHSSLCSAEKAKKVLGYTPKYNTIETILDCLSWQQSYGDLRSY